MIISHSTSVMTTVFQNQELQQREQVSEISGELFKIVKTVLPELFSLDLAVMLVPEHLSREPILVMYLQKKIILTLKQQDHYGRVQN